MSSLESPLPLQIFALVVAAIAILASMKTQTRNEIRIISVCMGGMCEPMPLSKPVLTVRIVYSSSGPLLVIENN